MWSLGFWPSWAVANTGRVVWYGQYVQSHDACKVHACWILHELPAASFHVGHRSCWQHAGLGHGTDMSYTHTIRSVPSISHISGRHFAEGPVTVANLWVCILGTALNSICGTFGTTPVIWLFLWWKTQQPQVPSPLFRLRYKTGKRPICMRHIHSNFQWSHLKLP